MGTLVSCEAVGRCPAAQRITQRSTVALPQLTDEQRKAALEKAAQARHERAELREKIKSGKVALEDVLDSDDPSPAA